MPAPKKIYPSFPTGALAPYESSEDDECNLCHEPCAPWDAIVICTSCGGQGCERCVNPHSGLCIHCEAVHEKTRSDILFVAGTDDLD